jgi:putative transposase
MTSRTRQVPWPDRRTIRLRWHHYAGHCWYHVTICSWGRRRIFGTLSRGVVTRTEVGDLVARSWQALPGRMPHVGLDEWIVMPNHLHGLIRITHRRPVPSADDEDRGRFGGSQRGALSLAVNLFKGDVTREARAMTGDPHLRIWHRGYYESIIRTPDQMEATRRYIRNNPRRG